MIWQRRFHVLAVAHLRATYGIPIPTMEPLTVIWLLVLLWLAGAGSFGYPLALRALPDEVRLAVLIPYAISAGYLVQGMLLMAFWGVAPLGTAFYAATLVSILAGAVVLALSWRRPSSLHLVGGAGRSQVAMVLLLAVLAAYLGYRLFTIAYTVENQEALFWHSAAVGELSRGSYPPHSPLEPDDSLRYPFGLHALAAALSADSGVLPPDALVYAVMLAMPLVPLAFFGASLRTFGSGTPGVLACVLGLFGGSISFYPALFTATGPGSSAQLSDALSGILWHGNTLDMIIISVTGGVGFAMFAAGLWITFEAIGRPKPSGVAMLVAVLGLAYLGIVNEVYYCALVAGSVGLGAIESLRASLQRRSDSWRPILAALAVGVASFALISLRGGLAGGIGLVGSGASSMQLVLNVDHFGSVITPPRGIPDRWVPVLSPEFQIDTNLWMVGVPILLVAALRLRNDLSTLGLLSAAAAFVPWVLVYPRGFPADIYRFGQGALMIYVALLPFALSPLWKRLPRSTPRFLGEALLFAALITPHLVRTASLAFSSPPPVLLVPGSADYVAARYLWDSEPTDRVFVPLSDPRGSWEDLYDKKPNSPGYAMRTILALSGHSIPIGHQVYWNPQAYLPFYRQASLDFDSAALAALKIDWVYVLPSQLDADQIRLLQSAEEDGRFTLEKSFGEQGAPTERLLFRVRRAQ